MMTFFLSLILLSHGREGQIAYEGKDPETKRDIWVLEVDTAYFHGVYHEELLEYSMTGQFFYGDYK